MDAEHHRPPPHPLDALAAAVQLDDQHLRHINTCAPCRVAWYQVGAFRAGCTDPRLGARMLRALDTLPTDPQVYAHLQQCLACRILALDGARALSRP